MDIPDLAKKSGASLEPQLGLDWWIFSPDKLQLFVEKIQRAERDKYAEVLEALEAVLDAWEDGYKPQEDQSTADQARSAIAKAKGES